MPVVTISAKSRWLPRRRRWLLTSRQKLVLEIADALHRNVAAMFGFSKAEVVINYRLLSRYAKNISDLWIQVEPMHRQSAVTRQEDIHRQLGVVTVRVIADTRSSRRRWRRIPGPSLDLELLFVIGQGAHFNQYLQHVESW